MPKLISSGGVGLSGGLSLENPFIPSNNNLLLAEGITFDEVGSFSKSSGFIRAAIPLLEGGLPAVFTGLFGYTKSNGEKILISTTKTGFYLLVGGGWSSIALPYPFVGGDDDLYSFAVMDDAVYFGNGKGAGNFRFDTVAGPAVYPMGIAPPSVAPVPSLSGVGVLTGTYSYVETFFDSGRGKESNPSTVSADIIASGNSILLSLSSVTANASVTKRRIYRTTTDGGVYLFLAEIAVTATSFLDSLPDSSLGIAVSLLSNGVPPVSAYFAVSNSGMFMAGGPSNRSRIYFSMDGKADSVHPNDFRTLNPDDGDEVTGLGLLGHLVAYKRNSIWNQTGDTRETIGFTRMVSGVGSVNHKSIVEIPGQRLQMFISEKGIYGYNGISETAMYLSIETYFRSLNQERMPFSFGIVYPPRDHVLWGLMEGIAPSNNVFLVYDYVLGEWSTRRIVNTVASVGMSRNGANDVDEFYIGGKAGIVWKGDTGYADDGAPITMDVIFRARPVTPHALENKIKSFNKITLWYRAAGNSSLNVSVSADDPNGAYMDVGVIVTEAGDGQSTLTFNALGHRIYVRVGNSEITTDIILRGMQVWYGAFENRDN